MADSVQRNGRDTFVSTAHPNAPHPTTQNLIIHYGTARAFTWLPMPGIRKRRIGSAILSCPVRGSWPAQTITVSRLTEDWNPRDTTWNDQPSYSAGDSINAPQPALSDQERIEIDVTDHVETIAAGADNWGWRISTNADADLRLYAFDHPDVGSWVLTIDFADNPEPPTDLAPNGTAVGEEPELTFDFTDYGGDSTDLASVRVQVNTAPSTSGPNFWDSGDVDTDIPVFDLADSSWPAPTAGTTYYWRVFVTDGSGERSAASDWASFTYSPVPDLVVDNPATGTAWDPTPTFAAHLTSHTIKTWQMRIARSNDKSDVIYNSGRKKGNGTSSIAHTIPFRDSDGRRILRDDHTYWLNIRVWDRDDREPPGWIQRWVQFTLDDDATPPRPTSLTATQRGGNPRVYLRWYRDTGFPEGWVILRDGEVIARLDPDEVDVNDNVYAWVDPGATPFVRHEYAVKVIDGSKQSKASIPALITTEVEGFWLLSDTAGDVRLDGVDVQNFRTIDRRATYQPLASQTDVDIVHAFGGVAGSYAGTFDDEADQDWQTARRRVLAMKGAPHREVQLVYANASVPVKLRNVSVAPSPDFDDNTKRQDVVFEAYQTSDFEVS